MNSNQVFCPKCGKRLPGNAKFCSYCGFRIEDEGKNESNNAVFQDKDESNASFETVQHEYQTLGGFLKFIVYMGYLGVVLIGIYGMVVILGLFGIVHGANQFVALLGGYGLRTGAMVPITVGCLLFLFAIESVLLRFYGKIRRKENGFLWFYHKMALISLCGLLCIYFFEGLYYGVLAYFMKRFIQQAVSLLIGTGLYTLYFVKSVRVRTYMGSADYLRCSPFTKNCKPPIPADGSEPERLTYDLSDVKADNKCLLTAVALSIVTVGFWIIGVNGLQKNEYSDMNDDYYAESGDDDTAGMYDDIHNSQSNEENIFSMDKVSYVVASSELDTSSSVNQIVDHDILTSWMEGVEGYGIGESITFVFDGFYKIDGFIIYPGNQKYLDVYTNPRPENIVIYDGSGQQIRCHLTDLEESGNAQRFYFEKSFFTNQLTFSIDSVYTGYQENTAISEIVLY